MPIVEGILEVGHQRDSLPQNLKLHCVCMYVSCHLLHIFHGSRIVISVLNVLLCLIIIESTEINVILQKRKLRHRDLK